MRDHDGYWVTDFDLIWSIEPLFLDTNDNSQLPISVINVNCHDPSANQFTLRRVTVEQRGSGFLTLSGAVAQFFRDAVNIASEQDDPAVLKRGLNAFLTQFARANSGAPPASRTRTSANKFYWTTKDDVELDRNMNHTVRAFRGYFASVRPSQDHLLLNVNTATSPFFHKMTVDEYILGVTSNLKKRVLDPREIPHLEGTLRGVRVELFDDQVGTFSGQDANKRVITQLGQTIDQQARRSDRYPPQNGPGTVRHHFGFAFPESELSVNIGSPTWKQDYANEEWWPASRLQILEYQPAQGQLHPHQTREMIEVARKKPGKNAQDITTDGMQMFGFTGQAGHNVLNRFNLSVTPRMIKLTGRLLPAPELQYGNTTVRPDLASWNLSQKGRHKTFSRRAGLTELPVIDIVDAPQQANNYKRKEGIQLLCQALPLALERHGLVADRQNVNMRGGISPLVLSYDDTQAFEQGVEATLSRYLTEISPKLRHLVILPRGANHDLYATLKRVCDLKLGLITFSVKTDSISKFPDKNDSFVEQYASNVALKCNLKGHGSNHSIRNDFSPLRDTIVLGADVAHPLSTASPGCPSIASVVGNVDDEYVTFPGSMRLQMGRQEFIDKMWDMVKERLIDWAMQHERKLPRRILFYRDGVSESQYDQLRQKEIPQISKAYDLAQAYLDGDWKTYGSASKDDDDQTPEYREFLQKGGLTSEPKTAAVSQQDKKEDDSKEDKDGPKEFNKKRAAALHRANKKKFELTYVVVGKRHNTRFYPLQKEDSFESYDSSVRGFTVNGNVKPGLLVDHTITHPFSFDFYLQSHQPLAGTGRAAHYFVLTNQMLLSPQELQTITHAFCFVYAKATRGVSYCAPAYYADRLCDRGRAYLRHWLLNRGDEYKVKRRKDEDITEYKARVMRHIYNSDYWRPHRGKTGGNTKMLAYGLNRRNPWHPIMDNIMFYL